jgi:LmbE family N-acetylglucosaminyl deacetylase
MEAIRGREDTKGSRGALRLVILSAHPDDETIGASAALGRIRNCQVCFLTDGAPRNPELRSAAGSRESYAAVRRGEAVAALGCAGVAQDAITLLGAVDQEALEDCEALLDRFLAVIAGFAPDVIITHPYEGGHPDHDTAALVARLAMRRIASHPPVLLEMASYHGRDGRRIGGEFLMCVPSADPAEAGNTIELTTKERQRKTRMLACYASQEHVLRGLPLAPERLRVAPEYDFTQPPHSGQLWYERLGWRMSGAQWRQGAAKLLKRT